MLIYIEKHHLYSKRKYLTFSLQINYRLQQQKIFPILYATKPPNMEHKPPAIPADVNILT